MKKYIILFLLTLFILTIYNKNNNKLEVPQQIIVINQDIQNIINKVNSLNKNITNFTASDIDIIIPNSIMTLKGCLLYEKNLNFRLLVNSNLGKEIDIGSNNQYLWFWSKRIKPPALYYALQEDIYLTRLKTPFHPIWMMESIGLNEIQPKKYFFNQHNNLTYLYYLDTNTLNEEVVRVIVINNDINKITQQHIFQKSKSICSINIKYLNDLPNEIHYQWHEEKSYMTLKFNKVQKNTPIHLDNWRMPDTTNKIDMSKD